MVEQADGFRSRDNMEQHVTVARMEFGGAQRDRPSRGRGLGRLPGVSGRHSPGEDSGRVCQQQRAWDCVSV